MPLKKPAAKKTASAKKTATTPKPAAAKQPRIVKKLAIARTDVFISYSQRDKAWMELLKTHLKPLERDYNITVWVDTKLRSGDKWRPEIERALAKTKVAVLLISPNFLASDFISTDELPPLLKASSQDGTIILPLLLSTSMFPMTSLSAFQAVNGTEHPLDLLSEGQINQTLFQVAKRIHEIFSAPTAATKSTRKTLVSVPKQPADAPATLTKAAKPKANRKATLATTPVKPIAARTATANNALLVRRTGEWEVIAVDQASIGSQLVMTLRPSSAAQVAFLATLRQSHDGLASVVFSQHTYRCTLRELNAVTEQGRETWHLTADTQELGMRTELTYSSLTPDMQAQARAELLLLNTHPPEQSPMRWLSGSGLLSDIPNSPLPALHQQVGSQPTRFKQVAPLVLTWFLHFTNTVQHILKLSLTLNGNNLMVNFQGQREAAHHEAPTILRVKGVCSLKATDQHRLLLGPIRNY